MPKKFQSILFWFDGAFTEPIASLTLSALKPEITGADRIPFRQKLQSLHNELAIGKIDANTYCRQAEKVTNINIPSDRLIQQILDLAEINQPFFDIYTQIAPEHAPKVVVDIPAGWFDQLVSRWKVTDVFPKERVIFTEQFDLKRMYPDIFYFIPQSAGRSIDECLMVDPRQMRAVASHKLGLASAAYVYPRRLKIDLALQGIWKTSEDIFHPKAGARANL